MNTMADLRDEVASRLRNALHGREVDLMGSVVTLPHMLGITPIGKIHDPQNEEMTILDPDHPFWQDYHEEVKTKSAATEKVETAIRSLQEDDIFRMIHPYGEEADVVYIEVDEMAGSLDLETDCARCDEPAEGSLQLQNNGHHYSLRVTIKCDECGFSGGYASSLIRQ